MSYRAVTTQWCAVWDAVGGPEKSSKIGDIAPGQEIGVEDQFKKNGDLQYCALVVWPDNLYPEYLAKGKPGYVERAHIKPVGDVPPGNATLNGIMAQLIEISQDLALIKAKLGI